MSDDKKIGIDIHTQATGDGAKKTTEQIKKLKEGSKQTAATAEKLRKEIKRLDDPAARKELEKTAMKLDQVAYDASKAAAEVQKLARKEARLAQESKDLAKYLNKTGESAEDYGREMTQAEQATRRLIAEQRRANSTANASPSAMGKAAKGKRQLGLAALEASRGIEDMQYGIRGAINNIPGLILMLGGTAGLTAVISTLVVGLAVLVPLLGDNSDALTANAKAAENATDKKVAAARADREASAQLAAQTARNKATLDDEINSVIKSVKAIDDQTAARARAFASKQQIANVNLSRDIALISSDDSLSDFEKTSAIIELKRQADEARRAAEQQKLATDLEKEKAKIQKVDQSLDDLAFNRLKSINATKREIEQSIRGVEDLKKSLAEASKALKETTIPALDKVLSSSTTEATLKNPLRLIQAINPGAKFGTPDRGDFDSDEAFLGGVRGRFDKDQVSPTTREAAGGLLKNAELQQQQIGKTEELIAAEKKRIDGLKEQLALAEEDRKTAVESRNKQIDQSRKKIELLKEEKSAAEELAKAEKSRDEALDSVRAKDASKSDITREASELRNDLEGDLAATGAAADEIAAAKKAADEIAKATSTALRDGVIDTTEFQKISTQLAEFRRQFGTGNQATLTNIQELMSAVSAHIKVTNAQGQQIKVLQSQIISR